MFNNCLLLLPLLVPDVLKFSSYVYYYYNNELINVFIGIFY